jgi:hypothetical protein
MKKLTQFTAVLLLIICVLSCSHSPLRKVENSSVPFDRPGYSILPPAGGDWKYYSCSDNSQGRFILNFCKIIPDTRFHSLCVEARETAHSATFENPQEFEKWVKKSIEMAINPNRLHLLDKKTELDNNFGPYTVRYYTKSEDHGAVNRGNEPFLLLVVYGYVFVHPSISNLLIWVSYSERGRSQDIRPDLKQAAELFFNGIEITKKPSSK